MGAQRASAAERGAGEFDYYLLALSWSPTFCEGAGDARRDPVQCGKRRGFIVHGLWPQFDEGFPRRCVSREPRDVPASLARRQLDIMPSVTLIEHEWDAHGICTGLTQGAYFETVRALRVALTLPRAFESPAAMQTTTPAALRAAFMAANHSLAGADMAIVCNRGRLEEVRICFSKTGRVRACGADVKDRCPQGRIMVPAGGPR